MHAEPQPAQLPFPGGQPDATVRLHPLLIATGSGPEAWFHREEGRLAGLRAIGGIGSQTREVPYVAFLVEHPHAGLILIDTGFHPSVAVNPRQNLGRVMAFAFKDLQMDPAQAVSAQLRERGMSPGDIRVVIMTHLHADHASAIAEFPDATFIVSKREWEAASEAGQMHGYVKRQFDHGFDYRLLDFEGPDASSFSGFGRSFDLFGDGSMRTVFTPGHSLGHMSVVLRTKGVEVLVAGDAIYLRETLETAHLPYRVEDEHLFRRSLREIAQYRKETPDALIIPGHDWEAWQALEAEY